MKRFVKSIALVVIMFLGLTIHAAYAEPIKPPTATSWYVVVPLNGQGQALYDWMYWRGYELGQANLATPGSQYSLVALMFGRPEIEGTVYGASGYDNPNDSTILPIVSVSTIEQAVEWFGWGYKWGAGSDTQSFVGVLVSTSNDNSGNAVIYPHGQQWSLMVNRVNGWFGSYVRNSGHQVYSYGGIDAEPGFSVANYARDWTNGYISAAQRVLVSFGSADGCPQYNTTGTPGSCNNGWNQEDVQWLSEGAPASCCSLPQIYSTAGGNARQWQQISLYSYLAHGGRMTIYGPLSQYAACLQRGGCSGTDNTSQTAWSQLWNRLNEDSRTAQDIWYSSDMKWR